jgi:methionyl-tRNA synthetase
LASELAEAYESLDTSRAMRTIMALADRANEFVEAQAPWSLKKDPAKDGELLEVCAIALNLFRQITVYLAPVLPRFAEESARLLSLSEPTRWEDALRPVVGTTVAEFRPLMERVDPVKVAALLASARAMADEATGSAGAASDASAVADGEAFAGEALAPECSIEDFGRVDLRVARIVKARAVPKADKLLELEVSLGGDERRTIFAGIKHAYDPESLVGRLTVVVANLAPRKMKLGTSEGMVLAAGPGGSELFILSPDSGAKAGQRIR